MAEERRLTPTEKRLLEMLSDGMPHTTAELGTCLNDELGNIKKNVRQYISNMRPAIRRKGQEIVCEIYNRKMHYRHVRMLKDPNLD